MDRYMDVLLAVAATSITVGLIVALFFSLAMLIKEVLDR
jgi:hypothetical protein